jgi:hypothetical protein
MRNPTLFVAVVACFAMLGSASATPVQYTIDPTRSHITVLGAFRSDSFQPRVPGSSTISYGGAFFGDLNGDDLTIEGGGPTDTARSFGEPGVPPAYDLVANTFEGDAFLSILSITFSGRSAFNAEPFSISAGTFPGHLVRFFIGDGTMQFQPAGSASPMTFDMHGRGAPNTTQRQGTISTANGVETLTVPLDMTALFSLVEENDTILTFSGEFVATRPVPEPGTAFCLLLGMGALTSASARSSGRRHSRTRCG